MTAPLPDDPQDWGPVERHERGFVREIVGFLLALIGALLVATTLVTIEPRLGWALLGLALVFVGLQMGRRPDSEVT